MSTNVTNLGRSGLYDWLVQRATAVILGVYFVVVVGFFLCNGDLDYQTWKEFIACTSMKVATILAFLSIAAHAWIGMWTVYTDYLIKDGHLFGSVPAFVRLSVQTLTVIFLLACTLWGIMLIWSL